ncbi:hypothetical protein TrVGV298_009087 [Trichoderma virens]|nr:hypothetical protein TrVGV298_009087 [Trichoderma virens]
MTEVSSTRLYLGNLPRHATKADVEAHFATHGTGEITEVKLMNGFGFIEYKDAMDARDVVPAFHGSDFMGERLTVQFARGTRHREGGMGHERAPPRPRRTPHRMQITGLPNDTSWQDLKDFARQSSLDVVYSETGRDSNGRGFVEFETAADLRTAVEKLDGREFKGSRVQCLVDVSCCHDSLSHAPHTGQLLTHVHFRLNPTCHLGHGIVADPARQGAGHTRLQHLITMTAEDRLTEDTVARPARRMATVIEALVASITMTEHPAIVRPPRRPVEDYPPPRGRYEEPYRRDYPPPPDPYANGGRPAYDRPPREFPPREPAYPREGGYARDYDRGGRYW